MHIMNYEIAGKYKTMNSIVVVNVIAYVNLLTMIVLIIEL